jgi:uncharacterized repeat protein (TIGR03803 family)
MRLFKLFSVLCAASACLGTLAHAQTVSTLYSFCAESGCPSAPNAALVQAANGDLYGLAASGGAHSLGAVFKLTPGGTLTTLYSFCAQSGCPDGQFPVLGLALATSGDLYGFTEGGGANTNGTFFRVTPSGTLATLNSFCTQVGCPSGEYLNSLLRATNGGFYFTTQFGGIGAKGASGQGAVYKITPEGTYTQLYSFCTDASDGCPNGAIPYAGVTQATNGDLYGTTAEGGNDDVDGTVFKITPSGTLTTLYSFCAQSGCPDGRGSPYTLIQATDGNLYGTSTSGGANNGGTVFKITPGGKLTTLYSFCAQSGCTDGETPSSGLVQHTNGILYGTTESGGANGAGTFFSLSIGASAFVETLPASGKLGASVKILGTSLKGATGVTFNGTAATFTVVSASEITTTVPAGATTGTVEVTTPSITLSSNVAFTIKE